MPPHSGQPARVRPSLRSEASLRCSWSHAVESRRSPAPSPATSCADRASPDRPAARRLAGSRTSSRPNRAPLGDTTTGKRADRGGRSAPPRRSAAAPTFIVSAVAATLDCDCRTRARHLAQRGRSDAAGRRITYIGALALPVGGSRRRHQGLRSRAVDPAGARRRARRGDNPRLSRQRVFRPRRSRPGAGRIRRGSATGGAAGRSRD